MKVHSGTFAVMRWGSFCRGLHYGHLYNSTPHLFCFMFDTGAIQTARLRLRTRPVSRSTVALLTDHFSLKQNKKV